MIIIICGSAHALAAFDQEGGMSLKPEPRDVARDGRALQGRRALRDKSRAGFRLGGAGESRRDRQQGDKQQGADHASLAMTSRVLYSGARRVTRRITFP
jgi:hypothetical protein